MASIFHINLLDMGILWLIFNRVKLLLQRFSGCVDNRICSYNLLVLVATLIRMGFRLWHCFRCVFFDNACYLYIVHMTWKHKTGVAAAEFSAQALPKLLQSFYSSGIRWFHVMGFLEIISVCVTHGLCWLNLTNFLCSPKESLTRAFVETDIAFREKLDSYRKSARLIKKDWHPGCTAIAAFLVQNKLYIANAGDCRAILCRAGHAIVLSRVSRKVNP